MPKGTNNEDQFKFLISCIRYSTNGKVDFDEVARECEIVTKGAAAKRYERLMKAHGIHQPQGPTGRDTGVQPLRSRFKGEAKQSPSKKRKLNGGTPETPKKGGKTEKPSVSAADEGIYQEDCTDDGSTHVKSEDDSGSERIKQEQDDSPNIPSTPPTPPTIGSEDTNKENDKDGADDEAHDEEGNDYAKTSEFEGALPQHALTNATVT